MQSTSQKANSFQSVFGIFLHACRAPEKVVETLAHMGISISMTAIYDAIKSLSVNARCALLNLGKTMCFAITYDNVDVLLKTSVLTVEKTTENLRHLNSVYRSGQVRLFAQIWDNRDRDRSLNDSQI